MKTNLIKKITCLAALGAVLAWANGTARAQIILATNQPVGNQEIMAYNFDGPNWPISGNSGEAGTGFDWMTWAGQDANSCFWDSTQNNPWSGVSGSPPGAMYVYENLADGQSLVGESWFTFNNYYPYYYPPPNYSQTAYYVDLSTATNLSFDVLWDTVNSTIGINDWNTEAFAGGNGDWGMEWWILTTTGSSVDNVATVQMPLAASNGWAHVNVPIPIGLLNLDQAVGIGIQKYTGTGYSGTAAFWLDNIAFEGPGQAPPPPTLSKLAPPSAQGLNIYDDGNSGDRQSIETVVTTGNGLNYGWIGNEPVTYSVNIAQGTPASYVGGQVHVMIMPGVGITELAPDWNEANAMVLFIERQADGSVQGFLRYKLNDAGDNKYLFGSATNYFGGQGLGFTNTIVAGIGGLLCTVTNVNGYVGTWSIEMTSDTAGQLIYPGGSASFAFPQSSDAQAFSGPVTVYWGVQPNNGGWYQDTVLSGVSISGSSPNTLSVDLTQPTTVNPNLVAKSATVPALLFYTPANAVYWLQWTLPDLNFGLQTASSLTGPWSSVVSTPVYSTAFLNTFDNVNSFDNARNYNPPPMGVGYDYGNATSHSIAWASGPTYDAGGSSASGSIELNWTWDTNNGAGGADFTVDLFPAAIDCSGGTISFDVMIDPSSTAGDAGDYGYFQVYTRDGSYNTTATSFGEGLLTAAGGTTGTWAHVSTTLGANTFVRGLTFQDYTDGTRNINGPETIYIDNLQVTASSGTMYNVGGLRSMYITSPMLPSSSAGFFRLSNP